MHTGQGHPKVGPGWGPCWDGFGRMPRDGHGPSPRAATFRPTGAVDADQQLQKNAFWVGVRDAEQGPGRAGRGRDGLGGCDRTSASGPLVFCDAGSQLPGGTMGGTMDFVADAGHFEARPLSSFAWGAPRFVTFVDAGAGLAVHSCQLISLSALCGCCGRRTREEEVNGAWHPVGVLALRAAGAGATRGGLRPADG